jgi:hypothetical protein
LLKRVFIFVWILSALASLLLAENKPGFAEPILGKWDMTISDPSGNQYPSWFDFSLRTETDLQADFVGRIGSRRHATSVDFSHGLLTVKVAPQYEKRTRDLIFNGHFVGEKMEGTTNTDDGKNLTWVAERAPDLTRTAPLRWQSPRSLFNGKDLSGWMLRTWGEGNCWTVEEGTLTNRPPCTDLRTKNAFSDFKLHAEFKIPAEGNSGIYLRGRYELQISDARGQALDALRMGAIYGFIKPSPVATTAMKRALEWQTFDVTLAGRKVTVLLNGSKIIEESEIPGITGGAYDGREKDPGPLMLQGDHSKVWFRNLTLAPAN